MDIVFSVGLDNTYLELDFDCNVIKTILLGLNLAISLEGAQSSWTEMDGFHLKIDWEIRSIYV